jgi:hypothetical protein
LFFKSLLVTQMLENGREGGPQIRGGRRRLLNEKRQVAWLEGRQRRRSKQEKQNSGAAPVSTGLSGQRAWRTI